VENITLDVYQWQHQECEAKKLERIKSTWFITTKSGNAELAWTGIPDSILKIIIKSFPQLVYETSIGIVSITYLPS
jgi:hypothetical protein